MEKLNSFFYLMVLFLGLQCNAAPKLRDPFSCSHHHGIAKLQSNASAQVEQSSTQPLAQAATHDSSSEWKVIAEKENSVVMQHRDGSIREITLGKK